MKNTRTEELIQRLAADIKPVYCLGSPFKRTAIWLAWSLPWAAAVVLVNGVRPDLALRLADTRWLIEEMAALATAVMAAMAALCAGVPGRPDWEHYIPVLPFLVWMGALFQGCFQDWLQFGNSSFSLQPDWQCIPQIILLGVGPAVAMSVMILRGAAIAPTITTALGGLAASGLAAAALQLFHRQDGSLMILVWQFGTVIGITFIAGFFGRKILRWQLVPAR